MKLTRKQQIFIDKIQVDEPNLGCRWLTVLLKVVPLLLVAGMAYGTLYELPTVATNILFVLLVGYMATTSLYAVVVMILLAIIDSKKTNPADKRKPSDKLLFSKCSPALYDTMTLSINYAFYFGGCVVLLTMQWLGSFMLLVASGVLLYLARTIYAQDAKMRLDVIDSSTVKRTRKL